MSSYVRLFYPNTTTTTSFESSFIDFGNKYVYRKYYKDNGLVNLTFGVEIISTDEFPPIFSTIQISNDPDFVSYKEINIAAVDSSVSNWFAFNVDFGTGVVTQPESGIVGATQPTNTELQLTTDELAQAAPGLFFMRGWPLTSVEGTKVVYIRFKIFQNQVYSFYPTTGGFYASVIWQKSSPSTPGKPSAINATDSNYIGSSAFWTFNKSQDLISNLESYSLNLRNFNNELYLEPFESYSNIIIPSTNEISYEGATQIEENGKMVFIYRHTGASGDSLAEITNPFTGIQLTSADDGVGDWEGTEISSHTGIVGKSVSTEIKFNFTSTDTIAAYDPLVPASKDQQYFAVIKNFKDIYSSLSSGNSLFFDTEVLSGYATGILKFDIPVAFATGLSTFHLAATLNFDVPVISAPAYYSNAIFVNPDDTDTNIIAMTVLPNAHLSKSYAMVSLSKQGFVSIRKENWTGPTYEKIFEIDEFPTAGILKVVYEDISEIYDYIDNENDFYINDTASVEHHFISQLFSVSNIISNINKFTIKLKNIGILGDTTDTIRATIVEANEQGVPVSSTSEPNLYFWNNVNTSINAIFGNTYKSFNNQVFDLTLTTYGSDISLYPGKKYLLIISNISSNSAKTKIIPLISSINNVSGYKRFSYIANHVDNNFTNTSWAAGGMKIVEAQTKLVNEPNKTMFIEFLDSSDNLLWSSYRVSESGQVSVFITKEGETSSKLLISTEIPSLSGNYRGMVYGIRNLAVSNNTIAKIDMINIENSKIISDINMQIPNDLSSDDIITGNYVYNGVPITIGNSDWINYSEGTQSINGSEDNIIQSINQYDNISFVNGTTTKTQVVFDASLFTSTNNNPDGGGQPDWIEPTKSGWVGKDLFFSKPLMDDSIKIESEYYFKNIKDHSNNEIYFLISSQQLYTNSPDIYRNYIENRGIPQDYLRVCMTSEGDINIYRNNNYEEQLIRVLYNIKNSIEKILKTNNVEYNSDDISSLIGKIHITLDNDKTENITYLSIAFSVYTKSGEHIIEVLSDYLEEKFTPSTNMGFYLSIGSRIKNEEREDSYLSIWDIKIQQNTQSDILISKEKNLYLYNEINGLQLQDREKLYPDISIKSNDGTYYDYEQHKYIKGLDNSTSKYYLLSHSSDYTLGYNEINWCDQVIQNIDKVKCWGIVVSNVADNRRSLGEPQRNGAASLSSGILGRDSIPPIGDRRNYSGSSAISKAYSNSNQKKLNLFVNSRSYSQNQYICSEWQWYEAVSPWSAETNWFGEKVTDLPSNLRANKPSQVDKLKSSDYILSFNYDFSSYANKNNFDIYFGISNFKPAYRAYNCPGSEVSLSIKAINIIDAGLGYTSAPAVSFYPTPEGGSVAEATAILEGGVVKQVVITKEGSGYDENTEVIFEGGTFSSSNGRAATGKPVIGPVSGASSEQIRYSVAANNGKWDYAVHDLPGVITGQQSHNNYDPSLTSVAFVYGEDFSYSNTSDISGIRGVSGQKYNLDRSIASYHILLPYQRQNSGPLNNVIVKPIDIIDRAFMYLSISNTGVVKITNVSNRESWSANTDFNNKSIDNVSIDLSQSGVLQIQIQRGTFTIDHGIDADTGSMVSNFTPDYDIDLMTIYNGEKSEQNIIIKIFIKSMYNSNFNYLYPFIGIREKANSGIAENIIGNVKLLPADAFGIIPVDAQTTSWWRKKIGTPDDNDVLYGRYLVNCQIYNDDYSYELNSKTPHIAQSFIISENNESFPQNAYNIPWNTEVNISCISLKVVPTNNILQWRCMIVPDSGGSPDIGSGASIDINTKYTENYYRPTTDINIYDSNILAISNAYQSPNNDVINFVFNPGILLDTETQYWLILTHPIIANSQNSQSSQEFSNVYVWSSAANSLEGFSVKAGSTLKDTAPQIVPSQKSMMWNVDTNAWEEKEFNLWYKIFKKYYVNSNNTIDNIKYSLSAAGVSESGAVSNYSDDSDDVQVDITAPWNPTDTTLQPIISGDNSNNIKKYDITINAQDIFNGNGSGIWRFRIGYYDDYNIQKFNPWIDWTDSDSNNSMIYTWTYPGNYINDKTIFVQIQDKVGNISETNNLTIQSEYGFIVDTTAPSETRVIIEGDALNNIDSVSITDKQNASVSLYAVDDTTDIKDFRINLNYEENSDGSPIYSSFIPMAPHYIQDLGSSDGNKYVSIQFRDYANNADQAIVQETIAYSIMDLNELPLAHHEYSFSGKSYLYSSTMCNITRTALIGYSISIEGYDANQVYTLKDSNNIIQSINQNETISVYVNSVLKAENTDYTINYSYGYILFTNSLQPLDSVIVNTFERVCKLYRYDGALYELIHRFTSEQEAVCTCMEVYNDSLYLGFQSGNIYTYNGLKIEKQFTITDSGGSSLPVGVMKVFKFNDETREYLYVGAREEARMWRYGGNRNITDYSWNLIDNLNNYVKIINGSNFYFNNQDNIHSIEGYEDTLFIGTDPNSAIFSYRRYIDDTGLIVESIDVNLMSNISGDYCGTAITSLCSFNNRIFAGTDAASIFYYKKSTTPQPANSDWSQQSIFNEDFLSNSYPYSFYETPGRTTPNLSSNISVINDINNNSSISISGNISEIVAFIDRNTLGVWNQSVSNSKGWTFEFEAQMVDTKNDLYGKQSVYIYDGTYQLKLEFDINNIYINNNIDTYIIPNNSIFGTKLIESYSWENNFTNSSSISTTKDNTDDKIRVFGMDYLVENDLLRLDIVNNSYPYLEVSNMENVFVNTDSQFEIKVKVKDFEFDSTQIYIQWSDKNNGPYIKEKTYILSVYNNNIWADFSFNPGWTGQVKSFRILFDNVNNAKIDIDYIRIKSSNKSVFNPYDMNKFRISAKNTEVKLYINDDNIPVFSDYNYLVSTTSEKSISFGKLEQNENISKVNWKNIKIYTISNISPLKDQSTNWILLNRFVNGKTIQDLNIVRKNMIAVVNPSDKILETDSGDEYQPRTYIMKENKNTWSLDSIYDINYINVLYSSVWNNTLYTTTHTSTSTTMNADAYNSIEFMSKNTPGYLPIKGDLHARRLTHAWDSVIKDTLPPETNIIINENEYSNGINIYELNIYIKELNSSNEVK